MDTTLAQIISYLFKLQSDNQQLANAGIRAEQDKVDLMTEIRRLEGVVTEKDAQLESLGLKEVTDVSAD